MDIINCHFVKRNALTIVVAHFLLRIPVVLSLVGRSDVLGGLSRRARLHAVMVMKLADVLAPNSTYYLEGSRLQDRAAIVPYGVDTDAIQPGHMRAETRSQLGYDAGNFILLAVQRLAPLKRVDMLIWALKRMLPECPGARLLVVGTGPAEPELRALARRLDVADAVRFCGYVDADRLPAMFGAADVFASHSESETFGVVFAEAMAAGLPIVAADTSSVRHVLDDESSVIVAADNIHEFVQAVIRLAKDNGLRQRMSAAGRRRAVEDFQWDSVARRYQEIIEQLGVPPLHGAERS